MDLIFEFILELFGAAATAKKTGKYRTLKIIGSIIAFLAVAALIIWFYNAVIWKEE